MQGPIAPGRRRDDLGLRGGFTCDNPAEGTDKTTHTFDTDSAASDLDRRRKRTAAAERYASVVTLQDRALALYSTGSSYRTPSTLSPGDRVTATFLVMADKSSHSPSPGLSGAADEKTRLTEEEKKQNHIASEQKRRQAIRDGFDKLCELVPGLEGQGRSEGLVLNRTVEYMREQLQVRRRLVLEREARGEVVDEKLREYVESFLHACRH
ncbi:putative BHLH domain-containing protein [Seiridium cardinale]